MDGYKKLFKNLDVALPEEISARILLRIKNVQDRAYRIRIAFFGSTAFLSLCALIPAYNYFFQEIGKSEFYTYFSLIFSDSGLILSYWKEFSLSLAESLPLLGIIAFVGTLFVLLWSLTYFIKNIRTPFYQTV